VNTTGYGIRPVMGSDRLWIRPVMGSDRLWDRAPLFGRPAALDAGPGNQGTRERGYGTPVRGLGGPRESVTAALGSNIFAIIHRRTKRGVKAPESARRRFAAPTMRRTRPASYAERATRTTSSGVAKGNIFPAKPGTPDSA